MDKGMNIVMGIDFQIDFCMPDGNLPVPGAVEDAKRFASFITNNSKSIDSIVLTHDSHDFHIATPPFWVDRHGNHPDPFSQISYAEARDGFWRANTPSKVIQDLCIEYLRKLEQGDPDSDLEALRFVLTCWNPHCQIGSNGATIMEVILDAAKAWSNANFATLDHVTKGSNPYTEHYSALKAAVRYDDDPGTGLDKRFIKNLQKCDHLFAGGEALNFCFMETFIDMIAAFDKENINKIVFLEDCMSSIPDQPGETYCQDREESFIRRAKAEGIQFAKSTDI